VEKETKEVELTFEDMYLDEDVAGQAHAGG
jgi:hypothetical protein